MKHCPRCNKELQNKRKKYCSEVCKYWYNAIRKEKEKHLAPAKKRNKDHFSMVVGSEWARSRGQGKRCNGMIKGAMGARVESTVEEWVPVTLENIKKHFQGIPHYVPTHVRLGNDERLSKEEIFRKLNYENNC
ncbi:MAG: hypothetical protein OQK82_07115 [Candidatus Pacearchaeota archaeon]|nr:hypothetical protein [Candidatus Pacearchaeota archaeon]